ncbi:MAG TPA: hypothetical protein VIW73_13215 [Candidatus Cybelea sp.]
MTLNFLEQFRLLRVKEIHYDLQVEPVLRRGAERVAKAKSHFDCHAAASIQQLVEARAVDAKSLRSLALRKAEWFQEILP